MRSSEDDPFSTFSSQSAVWSLKRAGYPTIGRWPNPDVAAAPPSAQVWDFDLHAALLTDPPGDTIRAPAEPPLREPPPDRSADDTWPTEAASPPLAPDPDAPTLEEPRVTVELPTQRTRPHSHRRQMPRTTSRGLVFLSRSMVVLSALVVALVVFLGVLSTLAPMEYVAATAGHPGSARWWPFLIHGPWLVAALSLVRAGIHHRRAVHSWLVIAAFAALSMALSISFAPKNMQGIIVAVLPAAAMTACLHQLVRQITLTRPPAKSAPEPPGEPRL